MRLITKLSLVLILGFIVYSCNDDDSNFEDTVRPSSDEIAPDADAFLLNSQTIDIKSIISRNSANTFLLGTHTDDLYGSVSGSILAQFMPAGIDLPESYDSTSLTLNIVYDSVQANQDSLVTINVYRLNDLLTQSGTYYTNYSPTGLSEKIGSVTFSAKEVHSDSLFAVNLDSVLCDEFFAELKSNPATFTDRDSFLDFFKGVYITAESGNVILSVTTVELVIKYSYKNAGGTQLDQIVPLVSSKEVKKVNQLAYSFGNSTNVPVNDSTIYLVGPAGKRPLVEIPLNSVKERFGLSVVDNIIYDSNNKKAAVGYAKLSLELTDSTSLTPPSYLMLVREADLDNCYKGVLSIDAINRVYAAYDTTTMAYTFDMQDYLPQAIKNGNDVDKLVAVPVAYESSATVDYHLTAARFRSKGNTKPLKFTVMMVSY